MKALFYGDNLPVFRDSIATESVGLINLLPIPVLDGGHILVFAIEAVRRRPLSVRTRDRINVAGLALVG